MWTWVKFFLNFGKSSLFFGYHRSEVRKDWDPLPLIKKRRGFTSLMKVFIALKHINSCRKGSGDPPFLGLSGRTRWARSNTGVLSRLSRFCSNVTAKFVRPLRNTDHTYIIQPRAHLQIFVSLSSWSLAEHSSSAIALTCDITLIFSGVIALEISFFTASDTVS